MLEHKSLQDGWFTEVSNAHFPGQGMALKVEKILHHSQSEFQDILVFESTSFGNVLVLDGIIQCTERDEFAYQEMIAHVALYAHHSPKNVLVIGGGDGGVIREVVKHDCVESVNLVEIDKTVIELSKKHLPHMSVAFNNPKVTVNLCDGFEYLKQTGEKGLLDKYDVIITDSSDPDGPAEAFFQEKYFKLLRNALKDDGIVIAQASENVWLDIKYLQNLVQTAKKVFPNTKYCSTMVPTYTSGQLGLLVCGKDESIDLVNQSRKPSDSELSQLRYYNAEIHPASFILPTWAKAYIQNDD